MDPMRYGSEDEAARISGLPFTQKVASGGHGKVHSRRPFRIWILLVLDWMQKVNPNLFGPLNGGELHGDIYPTGSHSVKKKSPNKKQIQDIYIHEFTHVYMVLRQPPTY